KGRRSRPSSTRATRSSAASERTFSEAESTPRLSWSRVFLRRNRCPDRRRCPMKFALPAAAFALTGAAALLAAPRLLRAADEPPHDAVERLMPQLMSDDDTVRAE